MRISNIIKKIEDFAIRMLHIVKYAVFGKPRWGKTTENPIEFAFNFKGKDYFCYSDPFKIPNQRGFVCLSYYEEFNMRMTKETLVQFLDAFEAEMNGSRNVLDIAKLINAMRTRTEFIVSPDTVYKLASVVFFTKEESTYNYDVVYNAKKIAEFKKAPMLDFFLRLPLGELIPFLKLSEENMRTYLRGVLAKQAEELAIIREVSLRGKYQDASAKLFDSQMEELKELMSQI